MSVDINVTDHENVSWHKSWQWLGLEEGLSQWQAPARLKTSLQNAPAATRVRVTGTAGDVGKGLRSWNTMQEINIIPQRPCPLYV